MKTKAEFLAMSDDDYAQAVLDSEAKQCSGCDSFGLHCLQVCALQEALKERHSKLPAKLTGRAARRYVDGPKEPG